MNLLLQQAIAALNLQPGQTYHTTVNGRAVEVRILAPDTPAQLSEEPCTSADGEMLDLRLDVPPSSAAKTMTVQRGEPMLPPPLILDETDLTPE